MNFGNVTDAFLSLSRAPQIVNEETFALLQCYNVFLYDRTSSEELFTKKGRPIEDIPPTEAALLQHVKRESYQAGHCWGQALLKSPELPIPSEWGWTKDTGAGKSCRELMKCGCKKGCIKNCNSLKASLRCTELCLCGGGVTPIRVS